LRTLYHWLWADRWNEKARERESNYRSSTSVYDSGVFTTDAELPEPSQNNLNRGREEWRVEEVAGQPQSGLEGHSDTLTAADPPRTL
jgi:hypothetical protein